MRIDCKTLSLSACLFALLCLSSVGYASPPSADVHFCRVLDFEDMQARDSLYVTPKQTFNLNAGEPRTVRMIYFLPNDRPFRQEVVQKMKDEIRNIQTFYADQIQAHGYGNKTFRSETDAQGEPLVHRVDGQHPDSHYFDDTPGTVLNELEQAFDLDANIYFIVIDNSINAIGSGGLRVPGVGGRRGKNGGLGLVTGKFGFESAAHELGHAFGLSHDFNDVAYIMSYGPDRDRLSVCNAEFLAVHPYFNLDTPIEEALLPSIELLSPQEYPAGSKSISVQIKISDLEELHQVLLFVRTREPHLSAGFLEVKGCRGLAGEKDAVVEFEYDGVIPSAVFTSLSDPSVHPIYVQTVDTEGNVGRAHFELLEISPHHIATLEEHKNEVYSIAFSSDGSTLASGSLDGMVKLWDVSTRRDIDTFDAHTGWVASLAFSPNGMMLASGSDDQTVKLWDVSTRRNLATFEEHWGRVVSVVFSSDGSTLASGSLDGTVKLWDVSTRRNLATLEGHMWGGSVAFSPDGMILAAGSGDGTIKLWDVATEKNIATFEGQNKVRSVAFSPDGETLASGSDDGTVNLWDVVTRTNLATLEGHRGLVHSVAFSPDGTTLASTSYGEVKLWDIATQNTSILTEHISGVRSVVFSLDGTTLVLLSRNRMVRMWNVAMRINLAAPFEHIHGISSVAFSPDGTTLASGSGRNVMLWDVLTRENIAILEGHTNNIASVSFSPDGTVLASGSHDKTIRLWNVETEKNIATLPHDGRVWSVSFSPDGTILASGSGRNVMLWDVLTRENIAILEGHTNNIASVSFSPDGTVLASGSGDRTVKLWDVAAGRSIATFEGHKDWVWSVVFLPYGTTLASGSDDGTALLWDMSEYITPVVNIPDANLRAVIRDALGKSRFAPITTTDMASLTTLNASNRNIRDLTGLESATNLTELNLVDNRLSLLSINTHIPVLQNRGVEVLFDKTPTPDFDGDSVVGFADFLLFVEQFGLSEDDEGYDVWFDLDGDGMIGFGDFLIFANAFGKAV